MEKTLAEMLDTPAQPHKPRTLTPREECLLSIAEGYTLATYPNAEGFLFAPYAEAIGLQVRY